MEILEQRDGGVIVLSLHGRLDGGSSAGLQEKFFALMDEGEDRFVVDGSELAYVSSSGLRVLLLAAKRLDGVPGRLVLCSLNQHIRKVLDISGLTSIFDICGNRDEAISKAREPA